MKLIIVLLLFFGGSYAMPQALTKNNTEGQAFIDSAQFLCTEVACYTSNGPRLSQKPKRQIDESEVEKAGGCDKGPRYFDGCNTCVCMGKIYACTLMACVPTPVLLPQPQKATISKREVEPVSNGCDKGHSYFDGCNTCVCQNGVYACTLRACYEGELFPDTVTPSNEVAAKSKRDVEGASGCDKGLSYFDGCNTCVCQGNNLYACTLRACFEGELFPDTVTPSSEVSAKSKRDVEASSGCDKGLSYFDGCNTCVCQNGVYACTLRACFEGELFPDTVTPSSEVAAKSKRDVEASSGCDKGHSYFDDCNECICQSNNFYACTRKACVHGQTSTFEKATTNESPAHSRKRREIEESTGKYDPPKPAALNFLSYNVDRCTPQEVKNQDCNRCKCSKNGKGWMCTRKRCPEDVY